MNITRNRLPLLQNLIKSGMLMPDPLNLGIRVTDEFKALGEAFGRLYAVGQILFGERLETTAVPELRHQCAQVSEEILCFFTNS